MPETNVGDLRAALANSHARWSVHPSLKDSDALPRYKTGARRENLVLASEVPAVDFHRVVRDLPTNPWIRLRRAETGILPASVPIEFERHLRSAKEPPLHDEEEAGAAPKLVDWRMRWGWPWITSMRDQNGCNACWAFSATALVEAMVRIEHCVWPWLSEGDIHHAMGAKCASKGDDGAALSWIQTHGIADPGCFAWETADKPYAPTPDHDGRSVRIPAYQVIGSVADQKNWLDAVGPLSTFFEVWTDFLGYGPGVYHRLTNLSPGVPNKKEGGHCMLVIGYDDNQGCWIVKNSWGAGWGQSGFGLIGYGEADIDTFAKYGLSGVDPDPWTKRRQHNGILLESGRGVTHRNFEALLMMGSKLEHWYRDNACIDIPWKKNASFAADVANNPALTATTYNRNLECVYQTPAHRLHHWWQDQKTGAWNDGGLFGPNDAAGVAGFIQSNYGAPGNFELTVRTADNRLNHWWRDQGGTGWYDGGRFAQDVAYSGPSLVQSHRGKKGHLELVCTLKNGQLQHWVRDNDEGTVWKDVAKFGDNVTGPPCMIEGAFGQEDEKAVGNFELCVASVNKVEHWWRANDADGLWRKSATFGHDVESVVGLLEGSYGFNLEVIVRRTDGHYQHYYRVGPIWYEGVVIA